MTTNGKLGIALLSFAHVHARGYADQVRDHPDCEAVVVWDEDAARGEAEAQRRNLPFDASLESALARPDVDAVVVNAPTSMHHDVLITAAQAGKHIFTEKSLTITIAEATEVMRAVEDAGIRFVISLPSRIRPEILFAKQIIDMGYLGEITQVRARIAHMAALDRWFTGGSEWFTQEEAAGGGAFFDLGCHRVDLVRWLLGEPASAVAQKTNVSHVYDIDDNMAAIIRFRSGALAMIDVSWVHRYGPNPFEIYGTDGYLGIDAAPNGPRVQLISGQLKAGDIHGYISPSTLPSAPPSLFQQWIAAIQHGTPAATNVYDGWNLVQLLDGCYTSAREGREVAF